VRRGTAGGGDEAEPGLRGLWLGLLAYRWATFAWMAVAAVAIRSDLRRPGVALAAVVATGAWNVWFSLTGGWNRGVDRAIDLGLAFALLPVSGVVMREGAIEDGILFFATSFPATAALTMGAGGGVGPGLGAGVALSVGLALSRTANGMDLTHASGGAVGALVNGAFYYVSAGGAAGVVRRVLARSGSERARAIEEAARQRERAARLAEREVLGREIHDSVLQALALVGKRGKELAARPSVPGAEVRELVEVAGGLEHELRSLLSEPPAEPPPGTVSVRTALEAAAFGVRGVPVTVTAVGPAWIDAEEMNDVAAAVRQALDNVVEHAHATRATVYAEAVDGEVLITIRDDGDGFDFDEERLAHEGKLGLLKSMRGRIEDLGGSMRVHTAPGRGTEVEFRLRAREVPRA
jgi:signal transduction histidine kinase